MPHRRLTAAALAIAALAPPAIALGQAPAAPPPPPAPALYPAQAQLVGPVDAAKLKPGDQLLARLVQDWSDGACKLSRGAVIVGHVQTVEVQAAAPKLASLALRFEASCPETPPEHFTLIALLAPDTSALRGLDGTNPVSIQAFRSSSFGEDGGFGRKGNTPSDHVDLSGRQSPNLPVFLGPSPDRADPRPTSIKPGQVWHIPNVALAAGTGPLGSSVLSEKKQLHLTAGTVFVLAPSLLPAVEVASVPSTRSAAPVPFTPTLDTEVCAAATCNTVLPVDVSTRGGSATSTISLAALDFRPTKTAAMRALEFGAALTYLGPDRLLLTYDSHALVPRASREDQWTHPRVIRAVLIDIATHRMLRSVDWRIADGRQYLWLIDSQHVLLHVGNELRLLGPELDEQRRLRLSGPLAFLSISPDCNHFLAGVIEELHTHEVHSTLLAQGNGSDPEEAVHVLTFGRQLEPEPHSARQSSLALPPVLTDQGQVILFHSGGPHWRYQLTPWQGAPHTLARVNSACLPEITSISTGLLLVNGCEGTASTRWYRVLRPDGTLVLKGSLLAQDLRPLALSSHDDQMFALTLPRTQSSLVDGAAFHAADLTSETIEVFRASNGQRVFAARVRTPVPTRQPLALSPAGGAMAVLDGKQIDIYALTR